MIKKASPLDYSFSVGRIRCLERFLFTEEAFRQAKDVDLSGALQLFAESELYADELLHAKDSVNLERLLNQESRKLYDMVRQLILDEPLRQLLDLEDLATAQRITRDYKSRFLQDYLDSVIDMHNIKTFLRLYVFKEPQEKLQSYISCAGFIPKKDFMHFYGQDISLFLVRLEYIHTPGRILDYSIVLKSGVEKAVKEGTFITLEKQVSDFLMEMLRPAKFFTFGPEPVLAYYWARVNEINLIRLIILAKLNNVRPELVTERLNTVYA